VDHDQIRTVSRTTRGHFQIWMNIRNAPYRQRPGAPGHRYGHRPKRGDSGAPGRPRITWIPDVSGQQVGAGEEKGCTVPGWCLAADMEAQRAEAREILEEEGFDFNKTYLFTVESDNQVVAQATFVQEQLRLLGIQTDFGLVETVAYRHQEQNGLWSDFLPRNATMVVDDPSAGLGSYLRCASVENRWRPGTPCDEKLEGLLDQVDSTLDPVK
jgi:hypothetical protein